jgi:hypothetical protein
MKSVRFPLMPKIGRIVPPGSIRTGEANEKEILRSLSNQKIWRRLSFFAMRV